MEVGGRDGWACVWCGRNLGFQSATLEHMIPRAHGGSDGVANLCLACESCNHDRGDRPADEHLQVVLDRGGHPRRKLLRKRFAALGIGTPAGKPAPRPVRDLRPLRVRRPGRTTAMMRAFERAQDNGR
jgi:hypothetical protein